MEEPGGLQSTGLQRARHNRTTSLSLSTHENVAALLQVCISRFYESYTTVCSLLFLNSSILSHL